MLEARVGIEPTHKGFADLFHVTATRLDSASIPERGYIRPLFVRLQLFFRPPKQHTIEGKSTDYDHSTSGSPVEVEFPQHGSGPACSTDLRRWLLLP
jgi:hypothetical protein